jgi:AcrR family transcriptional regulator
MPIAANADDPRVKRTRQLLQQAFTMLMQEKSFRDITVQDIADRATVNRATFYAHYVDKYDLFDSFIREQFHQHVVEKLPASSAWSGEHLELLIRAIFDCMASMQHDCSPADREFDPLVETAMLEEIQQVLLGWLGQPDFPLDRGGVPIETIAVLWSWGMFGAATQWSRGQRTVPAEAMARQIALLLERCMMASHT